MRTKILSLALTLMVIVFVAAALPVNAEIADIVVAGDSYTSQGKTETAGTGQFYGKQVCATSNAGYIYADYSVEIATTGYYNISISAAGKYSNGGNPRTTLEIDCRQIHGNYPAVGIASEEIITTDIARVYLETGTRSLRVVEQEAHYDLENITFSYDTTQTAETRMNLKPYAGSTTTTDRIFDYSNVPAEGSVDWATPHTVGLFPNSTSSNFNLTIPFVNGAAAYYDVVVASAGTTDATLKATIGDEILSGTLAATTDDSDVQETNLGRMYIDDGAQSMVIGGTIGSTVKYLYNIKLVKSANQSPDPIDLEPTDGTKTSDVYVFPSATATLTTKDSDWIDTGRVFILGGSEGHGVKWDYTVKTAGYYDVLLGIGYALTDGQVYARFDGAGTLQAEAIQTTAGGDVKTNNLGRIYLPAGANTLDLKFGLIDGNDSTHLYLWDVRLEYSDNQTEATSITLNAGNAKATSGTGEQNQMKLAVGTNTAGWATNSASKFSGATTYVDLDMYAVSGGYYDVYAAAGTISATGMISVRISGIEVIDRVYLTGGSDISVVQETYIGKVYIPAGTVNLRVESDTNSGDYYLYDLKFTKSATQPAANDIRIVDKGGLDLASEFYAGTEAYAEVMTTDDVKVFIVNYRDTGDGIMKMSTCQKGEVIATEGDVKIIRTSEAITASAGSVKAFSWDGATYIPIDMTEATVIPVPKPEA